MTLFPEVLMPQIYCIPVYVLYVYLCFLHKKSMIFIHTQPRTNFPAIGGSNVAHVANVCVQRNIDKNYCRFIIEIMQPKDNKA